MTKIAIIGAGSMVFSKNLVSDILSFDVLKGATLSLMDIDEERLHVVGRMAENINRVRDAGAVIETTGDRCKALEGADHVITCFGIGGFPATKLDMAVPARHGVRQQISDTLAPGGIFRALRSVPVLLDVSRDMDRCCPDAWLFNYVNPMAMHCLALQRATQRKLVGLCHGVYHTRLRMIFMARLAGLTEEESYGVLSDWEPHEGRACRFWDLYYEGEKAANIETEFAGINHMAACLRFERDGRDLYPLLRKAASIPHIRRIDAVRLDLFERFGYFMTETSGHISEYLPWYMKSDAEIERTGLRPGAYIKTCEDLDAQSKEYTRKVKDGDDFIAPGEGLSGEAAGKLINAIESDTPFAYNGNFHNSGGALIANLPADSCVEVPFVADDEGIRPRAMGEIPAQCAAMMRTNISVQDLVVRAILERDREHVYHALMLDPNTAATLTLPEIRAMADEMLSSYGELLPTYIRL
jgi:alpha-galactosidase